MVMLSSMARFNTYQSGAAERPIIRKWLLRALIVSLLLHAGLFVAFRATKLEHFSPYTERLVPRAFTSLGRVEIDAKLLEPAPDKPEEPQKTSPQIANIELPKETPSAEKNPEEIVYKPNAPELVKPIVNEKPKIDNSNLQTMVKAQQNTAHDLDRELNSVRDQLIKDKPKISSNALLKLSDTTRSGGNASDGAGIPGLKSLDEALAGTGGGLHSGDKIGIRGGALFEFDKADLLPGAIGNLQKLGAIVKRYPNATLIIEGYADSIGSPDYNLVLSQRRADAVRSWLTTIMGVDPAKIRAVGYGSTNFIDTPTYNPSRQAEEQNNRRVEIGFRFPR